MGLRLGYYIRVRMGVQLLRLLLCYCYTDVSSVEHCNVWVFHKRKLCECTGRNTQRKNQLLSVF